MSALQVQVVHYEHRRCKFSESMDLNINNKTLVTPTFAPRLKSDGEQKIYSDVKRTYAPRQLSAQVVRILDTGRTLYSNPSLKKKVLPSLGDQTLDTQPPQSGENVLFVDPALEYLYYSVNMERLINTPYVSRTIRNYLTKFLEKSKDQEEERKINPHNVISKQLFREKEHANFWSCVKNDANIRMRLIRDTFNIEMRARADILIPPVPLIMNQHLLEVTIFMNEKGRAFSASLSEEKRECADYFIIHPKILKSKQMMATIKEYVSESETPITIFKFKNLNLCDETLATERGEFKSFLMEMSLITKHGENKAFVMFEAGNQIFPAAFSSFAIVSTGLNMDREDRRMEQKDISPFISRYDPKNMVMQSKETFLDTVENNDKVIPCYCEDCIGHPKVAEHDFIEYNRRAKEHYLLCREQEMREIIVAIEKQESQMGFEKLQRSSLKNLVDIIPR